MERRRGERERKSNGAVVEKQKATINHESKGNNNNERESKNGDSHGEN